MWEEMMTLTTQIEAVLNFRPLCPLSNNPNDLAILTPGHFLIGDSLTTIVEPSIIHLPAIKLSRFQHIQHIKDHFWKRWRKYYLHINNEINECEGRFKYNLVYDLQPPFFK